MTGPGVAEETGERTLTVNGSRRHVPAGSSVGGLLASLSLDPRGVVVELNGVILRDRDSLSSVSLNSGDAVEIVHFVGGG